MSYQQSALPEWEMWFKDLVKAFRKYYQAQPLQEKERLTARAAQGQPQTSPAFVAPSQLLVVWVKDKQLEKDLQILVLTRFTDEPDGRVSLYGPFPPECFLERTSPILDDDRWTRPWRPGVPYRKLVEDRLVGAGQQLNEHFREQSQDEPQRGSWPGSSWGDFGISWECFSDIRRHDQVKLISDLVSLMKPVSAQAKGSTSDRTKAFGTYSHEPLWIGDQPVPTYGQRLQGYRLPPGYWEKAWSFSFADTRLIAWRDGLIAVEKDREDDAIPLLNGFMAVASLFGLPTLAVS